MNRVLYFALGAICGGAGVYFFMKDKFAREAQEEIDSVKEAYKTKNDKKEEEPKEQNIHDKITALKPDIMEYAKQVQAYRTEERDKEEKKAVEAGPYEITEEDFGEGDYETESLMLYSDGILTYDINDEVIEDIDDTIGEENFKIFEKSDNDAMYIRNENRHVEYEVLKSLQSYEEVKPPKPKRIEQEE